MSAIEEQTVAFVRTAGKRICHSLIIRKEKNAGMFVYFDKETPSVFSETFDKNDATQRFWTYNSIVVYKTHKNARCWHGLFIY